MEKKNCKETGVIVENVSLILDYPRDKRNILEEFYFGVNC